ncbi:transposase [Mesorhizobium sp. M0684]|uniref:transposase n=1 Tax=Mesorhizobium sp. M0684 TaxID=2956986 RepID=UPI003334E8AC
MTNSMINLRTLVKKTPDADLLREMIGFAAERLMEMEVGAATGGGFREKNSLRLAQRNATATGPGLGDAGRHGRAAHPQAQEGSYFPGLLEPRQMAEKALTAVVQQACRASRRARSTTLVKAMGMSGISKSQLSRLCEEIGGKVKAFLERLIEGDWPYLWIDATYLKVRRGGRIVSVAVIIAVGVIADGRREILAWRLAPPRPSRSGPSSCASSSASAP